MPMVSLQLSDELLKEFTHIQQRAGFLSRSEALREAIIYFIEKWKNIESFEGLIRVIMIVEYKSNADNFEKIANIENTYSEFIKTYSECQFGEKNLRTYIILGDAGRIRDFHKKINALKEVSCNIFTI
ncbi:MAG: CopG family ribbon-helix-helix protein [Promethearchaeota archaeon]